MKKKGFTLIELLIVISIIGILAIALIPNLTDAPRRARDAARLSNANDVVAAVETYYIDNGDYPTGSFCINSNTTSGNASFVNTFMKGNAPNTSQITGWSCNDGTKAYVKYKRLSDGYLIYIQTETDKGYDVSALDSAASSSAARQAISSTTSGSDYAFAVVR